MPPVTPKRTRATPARRGLLVRDGDLALGDLLEGHRQVVLRARLDERRRKVVEGALAELMVIVVDLPGALGGRDHEAVTRAFHAPEQIVQSWMHHRAESLPASSRSSISPALSVARSRRRRSSSRSGASTKMVTLPGTRSRTARAPVGSSSSRQARPWRTIRSISEWSVPERWVTKATYSRNSPAATRRSNSSSLRK